MFDDIFINKSYLFILEVIEFKVKLFKLEHSFFFQVAFA